MFGNGWNSEYYDIVEFYYWEPQHLGKIKNPFTRYRKIQEALSHIQNMEVSLNHQFNIFFMLAPCDFVNGLVKNVFDENINDTLKIMNRYDIRELISDTFMQPDIF